MDKLRYIVRELVKRQLKEANVTANLDGGEGPPKTPYAFSKNKKKDDKKKEDKKKRVYENQPLLIPFDLVHGNSVRVFCAICRREYLNRYLLKVVFF